MPGASDRTVAARRRLRHTAAALTAICVIVASAAPLHAQDAPATQPAADAEVGPETKPEQKLDAQAKRDEQANQAKQAQLVKKLKDAVQFWPNSISFRSYLHFDEQGEVRSQQHSLDLNVQVSCPQDLGVMGYRVAGIDKAVTSAGEALEAKQPNHFGDRFQRMRHHGNGPMRFNIGVNLPLPTKRALRLKEVSGRVRFSVADGPRRKAVLDPVKKYVNKRIHINDFDGSRLRVEREGDGQVKVTMNNNLMSLFEEAKFHDADGRSLDTRGWGSGSRGDTQYRSYRVSLPEDGRVVLYYYTNKREVELPFVVKDVPLPKPPDAEPATHLSIDAEPVDQMGANVDGVELLELVIKDDLDGLGE